MIIKLLMNKYRCLKNQSFSKNQFSIVPIRNKDKFKIMEWRNQQIYHLRQSKLLTKKDQDLYFKNVVTKLFDEALPSQILFSYLKDDSLVGYGGLVNINWSDQRGEVSFLVDTALKKSVIKYNTYFSTFLFLIKQVAFDDLYFHRIYTETYEFRNKHIKILENNGFVREGIIKENTFMQKEQKFYDSLIHGLIREDYER